MDANPQAIEPPIPLVLPINIRAGLISLADAQNNKEIVYHSISIPQHQQATIIESYVEENLTVPLITLAAAQARDELKYGGFEM